MLLAQQMFRWATHLCILFGLDVPMSLFRTLLDIYADDKGDYMFKKLYKTKQH